MGLASCGHNNDATQQLSSAESIMTTDPDSALTLLNTIDTKHLTSAEEAQYGVLTNKARVMSGKTIAQDNRLDFSIAHYTTQKDSVSLTEALQLAAIRSRHRRRQDSTIFYLNRAINATPDNQKNVKSQLLSDIAYQLTQPTAQKDYVAAIAYAKQSLQCATTTADKARALHDIGLFYSYIGINDSSLYYIEKAIDITKPDTPDYTGFVLNYAALPSTDYNTCKRLLSSIGDKTLGVHITLGFLHLNNGHLDSASVELTKAHTLYMADPDRYSINTFNNLRLLKGCVDYGCHKKIISSDGVITNDSIQEMINLERRLSTEKNELNAYLQTRLLEQKVEQQKMWLYILLIVIASTLIIFINYFRWHKKHKRLQQELNRQRISQILIEASDETIDEERLQAIISQRVQLCTKQFRDTGYYAYLQKQEGVADNETFIPLKQRNAIQEKLLECFSDFVIDLKKDGAKLNLEDITYCLLSLLNINTKTISRCMGVSEGAVRTRKSRLKTKLSPLMYQTVFHDTTI